MLPFCNALHLPLIPIRTIHTTNCTWCTGTLVHALGWICVSCFQTINSLNGLRTTTTAPNPAFWMHVHTNKRFFICYTKVNIDFVLSTCTRHHLNDSSYTFAVQHNIFSSYFLRSSARLFVLIFSSCLFVHWYVTFDVEFCVFFVRNGPALV